MIKARQGTWMTMLTWPLGPAALSTLHKFRRMPEGVTGKWTKLGGGPLGSTCVVYPQVATLGPGSPRSGRSPTPASFAAWVSLDLFLGAVWPFGGGGVA